MTTPQHSQTSRSSQSSLRLLVLGGTSWLGGEVARQAVSRGHHVTCLARGQSGEVPPGVSWVHADRWNSEAYEEVTDQLWDAVVDVSRQPEQVRTALGALAGSTRHWVYVSSCSVYADDSTPGADESAAVHPEWSGTGEATAEEYGPAKVACEAACRDTVPADRLLIARAGLIVGYGDRSDRFGYWPARVDRVASPGEPALVPMPATLPAQVVDVLDLTRWLLESAESGTAGTFNALGDTNSLEEILARCAAAVGREPSWVAAESGWLEEQGVQPWMGEQSLPLWLPMPAYAGFMTRRNDAAKAAGLTFRGLDETIEDTLRWERELGLDRDRKAGLTPDRESALIKAIER